MVSKKVERFWREGEVAFEADVGGASVWDDEASVQSGLFALEGPWEG